MKTARTERSAVSIDPVAHALTNRSFTHKEGRESAKPQTSRDVRHYRYNKPKSHAELIRSSMKTFLTDINMRSYQEESTTQALVQEDSQQETERSKFRKTMYKSTTNFPKILERTDNVYLLLFAFRFLF